MNYNCVREVVFDPDLTIQRMENLKYESFLNSIETAFIEHRSGIKLTDKILLDFADSVIQKFADIYANTRSDDLGNDTEEIVLDTRWFNN